MRYPISGCGRREQLSGEAPAAVGGLQSRLRPSADTARIVWLAPDQIEAAGDALEKVVEVVSYPARQLADSLHLLRLAQRDLGALQFAAPLHDPLLELLVQVPQASLAIPECRLGAHALGRLRDDAQHASDAAIAVRNGRVGNVEIDGLSEAVPLDVERPILGRKRSSGVPYAPEQRLQIVPELAPALLCRATESARVLVADGGGVGVVVQGHELRTPKQHDLGFRPKQHGQGRLKLGRPILRVAQWRSRPIELPQQGPDAAARRKDRCLGGGPHGAPVIERAEWITLEMQSFAML